MDEKKLSYIDKLLNSEIKNNRIAGASVMIYKDGEICYNRQFGWADKENKIAVQKDTIFRLYSCTKPITATALMILFERGELELEYPLYKYTVI